jgi:hypothetical protein
LMLRARTGSEKPTSGKDFMATENHYWRCRKSGGILTMIFRTSLLWKTCKSKIT